MQKKLIALAVAAVTSGAAFAQTNVTIYGNVDMGVMFRQGNNGAVANGQSQYDLQSAASQSHIGFKGVEDLGNGLKAVTWTASVSASTASTARSATTRSPA